MSGSFSERYGIVKPRSVIQIGSMDDALRNGLWNVLDLRCWKPLSSSQMDDDGHPVMRDEARDLARAIWNLHLKLPIDQLDHKWWSDVVSTLRERFFKFTWNEVYDFLQFMVSQRPDEDDVGGFVEDCTEVMKREMSGYRFVGGLITRITSDEEIREIESATAIPDPMKSVGTHVQTALKLMSDRKSPDYRNSIKESISAVEAICALITHNEKATLDQCLHQLEEKVRLHAALKQAFVKLYGYTSDAEGIRHALMEEPTLTFDDAKFMLVCCSAFVNYVRAKASQAGIEIRGA